MKKILLLFIATSFSLSQNIIWTVDGEYKSGFPKKITYFKESRKGLNGAMIDALEIVEEKYYYKNGYIKREVNYKDGLKHGKCTWYYEDGQVEKEENYKNGNEDGKYTSYNKSGQIEYEKNYKDAKKHGKWTWYYEDGQVKKGESYKNGKVDGKYTSYNKSGKLEYEENYKDENLDGKRTLYYEDGSIKSVRNYKDGKWNGKQTTYYNNGHIKQEGNITNGKLDGKLTTYYEDGQLKKVPMHWNNRKGSVNKSGFIEEGTMFILEAEIPTFVRKLASKSPDELIKTINDAEQRATNLQTDFFDEFKTLANNRELRLIRYYTDLSTSRDNESVISALKLQRDDAVSSVLDIISNRLDVFGVIYYTINKLDNNRIIVELAGIDDAYRARKLIQRTASLEFTLVMNDKLQSTFEKIDATLLIADFEEEGKNEPTDAIDDIFSDIDNATDVSDAISTPADILKEAPFSGYLRGLPGGVGVLSSEYNKVKSILEREDVQSVIPREGRFLWASRSEKVHIDEANFVEYRLLYFVRNNPEISGGMVKNPQATIASAGTDVSGQWVVNLEMTPEGARKWSRFTGANVDKQVAIVLDEKIFMAPFIRGKVPGGRTQISGFADANEAKDISNVLRAGELPVPVFIIEERKIKVENFH